ncbi:hypothetical protein PTW37_01985 [Arthrobacter agilis]|uniref:hypothetical protein n=1 Tax=Arthrobacter agilis TaxID=37921 RepID=UPI002366259E|nr:hypothetical protein [Arthrobacter agilis]WDF33723.1 hypothetical protein PTW37_01985 [Arthrobacter agilis]
MATTEELLKTLRREIFAAEMKVILDKELGRETSPTVKRLAALKLPPRARLHEPLAKAAEPETIRRTRTDELLKTLRREIFAAEMKVILDKELGRQTSPTVRKLARMKRPPI